MLMGELSLTADILTSLFCLQIYPPGDRYEVPLVNGHPLEISKPVDSMYDVKHVNDAGKFGVRVVRSATGVTL